MEGGHQDHFQWGMPLVLWSSPLQAGDEMNGAPAQDITFIIEEKPHPVFKREVSCLLLHD